MSTKIITLCLEKIGREILGAVTVVPAEGGTESGKWDTPHCTFADDIPPARLRLVDGLVEEVVEEQIFEIWVVTIGLCDILQEDRSDDATTTPHESNRWLVKLPAVLLCSLFVCCEH